MNWPFDDVESFGLLDQQMPEFPFCMRKDLQIENEIGAPSDPKSMLPQ